MTFDMFVTMLTFKNYQIYQLRRRCFPVRLGRRRIQHSRYRLQNKMLKIKIYLVFTVVRR